MKRALFIDKDGTLIENMPGNLDPARIRFTRGALDGLRRLQQADWALVIVSNQPALGEGRFTADEFLRAQHGLVTRLREEGEIQLTGFYACPHVPGGGCRCRKPAPGMLELAAVQHGIALNRSWMVGDILDDVEAGRRAGCRTVLLDVGNETEWQFGELRLPDHLCSGLDEVAELMLAQAAADPDRTNSNLSFAT
ncbi:MAG TPA: HAD-IIIA family hydrolase [Burkholderiaceae bacterium]|nr:HAD-IIIA family hydrolase [Burkholderiaceae bacterium]